ncbi:UDP-glucose 4-epimerase GalE [Bacillus sp. PS06]|uniref:UDP-glucose 4-epimerase GalE n=1 Tax=Bacillus sp. PS06 TaxID=2764176 RepID=UPI001787642C|nr:UDP-glucose 4-epimerase GalE [Bacillus sp. PS06]MBD8071143.1 UDP-glucose 4-epimerase GalE [Bacillus sp. PS06]
MSILVTGGAGYIGSHTCVELLNAGYDIIVLDNFSNSNPESLQRVRQITNKSFKIYDVDLLEREKVEMVFEENHVEAVLHFAGLKAVGESVSIPIDYYQNNITGTLVLLEMMARHKVKKIVFSSSATVYGANASVPIIEDSPLGATNPYGSTKLIIEQLLNDVYLSDRSWGIVILRYFNPIGAHISGEIGEDPKGKPNNLMPYITQVAAGKHPRLNIYGKDYPTHDGTGVRDYIHVVDLATGHIKALEKVLSGKGIGAYNLGTGTGISVLDLVHAFEQVTGLNIQYQILDRRPGDSATCFADPKKAREELGWEAIKGIEDMCRDAWRWQSKNPNGYKKVDIVSI